MSKMSSRYGNGSSSSAALIPSGQEQTLVPVIQDRLKALYPFVNEAETPLPRAWSSKDKYSFIGLSMNNQRVLYRGIVKKCGCMLSFFT